MSGRTGARFRRPLTESELATIIEIAHQSGAGEAINALWDIILAEAEGATHEEAGAQGLKLDPIDYAIPRDQETQLHDVFTENRRGPLNLTPAWYDDTDL